MGFFDFISSNKQPDLQQQANQQMVVMLQERLKVATCPTERQQLTDNIQRLQMGMSPQIAPQTPSGGYQPQGPPMGVSNPPQGGSGVPLKKDNEAVITKLSGEIIKLKAIIANLENLIVELR